jgi:predicted nuclease of predicted toxin-antitoxin system
LSKAQSPLRTFLDAGVPDSVGRALKECGHFVILHREALSDGASDELVCATALLNEAILVAIDGDMKRLAKQYGVTPSGDRFAQLSVIRLCCNETQAAHRVRQAMTLIEHEWRFVRAKTARRLWVDVGPHYMRTNR